MSLVPEAKKGHNKSRSGPKIAKRRKKELEKLGIVGPRSRHNPKAFTFSGGHHSVHRRVQHASEVEEKRLRKPKIVKNATVAPPLVIVVQGPRGVGKSTLISSLVKHHIGLNISSIDGPITMVTGKNRRVTLIECGTSMVDAIDCCKIADVALCLIDASVGYEMETFEFVHCMQTHGFPRVIGVVTHVDHFREEGSNKTMRNAVKAIRKRFWSEVYNGAKMFPFTGIKYGHYRKNQIGNLSRFLANIKAPSLSWRLDRFYCICHRHEILNETSEGQYSDVAFYAYINGARVIEGQKVHIPGAGDLVLATVSNLDDPCPVQTEGRTLKDKNRNVYAPYCNVGTVMLDQDAMYIQLAKAKQHFTIVEGEDQSQLPDAVVKVRQLQQSRKIIDDNIKGLDFTMFGNGMSQGSPTANGRIDPNEWSGDNGDNEGLYSEDDGEDEVDIEEDEGIVSNAGSGYNDENDNIGNDEDEYSLLVYGEETNKSGTFADYTIESTKVVNDWNEEMLTRVRGARFINHKDQEEADDLGVASVVNDGEDWNGDAADGIESKQQRLAKELQDNLYNEALALNTRGNVGHFCRLVVKDVPIALLRAYATLGHPIIIGGLQSLEQTCGFMQIKIKRHRWSPRILKTNDPLLFSIGWRRWQSLPVYCMEQRNGIRNRMLKYTPEHLHCLANVYGPMAPPSSGVLAIRNWDRVPHFGISASGVIIGTKQSFSIVKKLKLIGEPYKTFKNTAFIRNMFNSELEVIKCLGSKLVTASGIRGQIKKPQGNNGNFRATFEDKILASDLVILKCYTKVETKMIYNPMLDYGGAFKRIKQLNQLRPPMTTLQDAKAREYERKQALERPQRRFNAIKIPKPIVEALPFSAKPKVYAPATDGTTVAPVPLEYSQRDVQVAQLMQKLYTIRKDKLEARTHARKLYKAKQQIQTQQDEDAKRQRLKEIIKSRNRWKSKIQGIKRARMQLD